MRPTIHPRSSPTSKEHQRIYIFHSGPSQPYSGLSFEVGKLSSGVHNHGLEKIQFVNDVQRTSTSHIVLYRHATLNSSRAWRLWRTGHQTLDLGTRRNAVEIMD